VTVIGVFLITALVEGVRRAGREYDRRLVATARARGAAADKAALTAGSLDSKDINIAYVVASKRTLLAADVSSSRSTIRVRPTAMQQLVRAGFFGVQFTVAYLLMLLAMYYNGFVIMVSFPCLPVLQWAHS
jgi:copper transporter 1